jgi:hypothetical protein
MDLYGRAITAANPLYGARLATLITELRCATIRTERKVNRLADELTKMRGVGRAAHEQVIPD